MLKFSSLAMKQLRASLQKSSSFMDHLLTQEVPLTLKVPQFSSVLYIHKAL